VGPPAKAAVKEGAARPSAVARVVTLVRQARTGGVLIAFLLIIAIASVASPYFLSALKMQSVMR
jgi:hypothetical protein